MKQMDLSLKILDSERNKECSVFTIMFYFFVEGFFLDRRNGPIAKCLWVTKYLLPGALFCCRVTCPGRFFVLVWPTQIFVWAYCSDLRLRFLVVLKPSKGHLISAHCLRTVKSAQTPCRNSQREFRREPRLRVSRETQSRFACLSLLPLTAIPFDFSDSLTIILAVNLKFEYFLFVYFSCDPVVS